LARNLRQELVEAEPMLGGLPSPQACTLVYNILHLTHNIYITETSIYFNKCL